MLMLLKAAGGRNPIDIQHEHIHAVLNALIESESAKDCQTTDILIAHICRFIEWHFSTEEAQMRSDGYPELQRHLAEHRSCLEALAQYRTNAATHDPAALEAITSFLTAWLTGHMRESDRHYEQFLAASKA